MEPVKVSRADIRYDHKVNELKDLAVFDPKTKEERLMLAQILTHYIDTIEITNTRGGESDTDGGDI